MQLTSFIELHYAFLYTELNCITHHAWLLTLYTVYYLLWIALVLQLIYLSGRCPVTCNALRQLNWIAFMPFIIPSVNCTGFATNIHISSLVLQLIFLLAGFYSWYFSSLVLVLIFRLPGFAADISPRRFLQLIFLLPGFAADISPPWFCS